MKKEEENDQCLLPQSAIDELKKRVTEHHGSLEKFAAFIRNEMGVSITLGSIYRTISGKQSTSLERYRAIATSLKFSSVEEAFPPNPDRTVRKK